MTRAVRQAGARRLVRSEKLWDRAIAAWLGIATGDAAIAAMQRPQDSPFARFGPAGSGVAGGNDPVFLAEPAPHGVEIPPALVQPDGWSGPAELWDAVVRLAERLGYTADTARGVSPRRAEKAALS